MTQVLQPILSEFHEEAAITRRVLERIPADKLSWKPHQKSMSLGQLALHLASVPGRLARILQQEEFEPSPTILILRPRRTSTKFWLHSSKAARMPNNA